MAAQTDWQSVERWMILHDNFPTCAKEFNLKEDTVRKRARRYSWPLPSVIAKRAAEIRALPNVQPARNGAIIERSAKTLIEKGEAHAEMVFEKANRALRDLKKFPVRSARDVEVIDRVARRSAGLENDEQQVNVSLIALNERIEAHDVIEAEVIEQSDDALHDAQQPPADQSGTDGVAND